MEILFLKIPSHHHQDTSRTSSRDPTDLKILESGHAYCLQQSYFFTFSFNLINTNVTPQYIVLYCGGSKIIFLQIRDNSTCSASLATAPPVSADPAHVKTVRNLPLFMTAYGQIFFGNFGPSGS